MDWLEPLAKWLLGRPLYLKAIFFIAAVVVVVTLGVVVANAGYESWAGKTEEDSGQNQ
ncbi:MAG: hypothetical protein NTX98_00940 [Candidatus Doudnabacteria bacterium]|nr:hypothetical protein [Candidatus Doudnabacteria bacterium]